jgi:pSer/pThr/pTyr-binding forkhead associated (FHA) protein
MDAPAASLVLPDGRRITLLGRCTIGRQPQAKVVLDDPRASREHAVIRVGVGTHVLTDLASTNGTTVNGEPISERNLFPGDEIVIGSTTLRYELDVAD